MNLVWKEEYNRYVTLQRNHKTFNAEMLEKLINDQQKQIKIIDYYLEKRPSKILDIGCGLGIFDLALSKYYGNNIDYYLLDKTTTKSEEKKVYYGYREKASFYNNMDYTKEFLTLNGIDESKINLLFVDENINEELRNKLSNIDLIISIISWGFHYPVNVYLETVHQILADDGLVCFNCRNLTENIPSIQTKFNIVYPTLNNITEGCLIICKKNLI